jgi:5-formyltetrahydrofolate cyclo-ligase
MATNGESAAGRAALRAARRDVDHTVAQRASAAIAALLDTVPEWTQAEMFASYHAVRGELDPAPAVSRLTSAGVRVAYPRLLLGQSLEFALPGTAAGVPNRFAIPEPSGVVVPLDELALVLVPLVGFDPDGHRLGSGAGYYDRTFAGHRRGDRPFLIGVAYDLQRVERIDAAPWDVPLDAVVTETGIIDWRPGPPTDAVAP